MAVQTTQMQNKKRMHSSDTTTRRQSNKLAATTTTMKTANHNILTGSRSNSKRATMLVILVQALLLFHISNQPANCQAEPQRQQQQQTNLSASQATTSPSSPLKRPSIEEVASELSKKYLNLEHENWRLKSAAGPVVPGQQQMSNATVSLTDTLGGHPNEPERDIYISEAATTTTKDEQEHIPKDDLVAGGVVPSNMRVIMASPASLASDKRLEEQANRRTTEQSSTSEAPYNSSTSPAPATQARRPPSGRKRKSSAAYRLIDNIEENELKQCHQYLQSHSNSHHQQGGPNTLSPESWLKLAADQQLPCACEPRKQHGDDRVSVWLSCDHVQLIGSHLFSPIHSSLVSLPSKQNNGSAARTEQTTPNEMAQLVALNRYSQRDAGLQALQSQMFHYMQLHHLSQLDLSQNRIRQIKLDAFHGIELKLEWLDLSGNLLGDSRASFPTQQQQQHQSPDGPESGGGKLMLATEELSRLKNLKWLSLRNNQINQLASNVFVRQQQRSSQQEPTRSALTSLDLSENLLRAVPSDSIKALESLEALNLARNRISRLNQWSKFPVNLKYLDLSDNSISSIRHCDLIDLTDLIELNLSHNQLSHLDRSAFLSSKYNHLLALSQIAGSLDAAHEREMESIVDDSATVDSLTEPAKLRRSRSIVLATADEDSSKLEPPIDDLEPSESALNVLAALASGKLTGRASRESHQPGAETETEQPFSQFNSTLRLNLSYNFLENVPGDSLLKFPNLQQLDLSFNRIRQLDSNYLCSIYNLVENLRLLDLSGNLLSFGSSQNANTTQGDLAGRHLNKLFGCLQKIERLLLSANRFGAAQDRLPANEVLTSEWTEPQSVAQTSTASFDDQQVDLSASASDSEMYPSVLNKFGEPIVDTAATQQRLIVKFGEGFGSRHMKVLDLSDNQLRAMPIILQLPAGAPASGSSRTTGEQSSFNAITQLNQWVSTRLQMEELDLSFNHIERLEEHDLEPLFNLRNLQLDYNKLSSVPAKIMRRFNNLERLSVNGNRLSSLEPLNELFELSARSLKHLNLANNRLVDWPQMSKPLLVGNKEAASSAASFSNQESRQMQTDSGSQLQLAIEELNLDGNLLDNSNATVLFDQLIHMRSLRTLNLANNLLNKVKSEWFKFANGNLRQLHLSGNKINAIDLGAFAANQANELRVVNLDFNLLKELKRKTFDSMPLIRELNLANNMIHTIQSETFHQINSLRVLKLNNNKLTSWKCEYFSNLCNSLSGNINADMGTLLEADTTMTTTTPNAYVSCLQELDLSFNSLSQLRVNSISVHTKLVKLNLEHNKLSFIPHDLFKATTSGSSTQLGRQTQLASSLEYVKLAHNRIQTIDNINFRPLKNLISIDLSFNELQTLGSDVLLMDSRNVQQEQNNRRVVVSNNLTDILMEDDDELQRPDALNRTTQIRAAVQSSDHWPALGRLRQLNLAHNLITMLNQSILSELSPFAQLNLNLSHNYLDSESIPIGFFTKSSASTSTLPLFAAPMQQHSAKQPSTYDLVFTLKLESLDLSHNRLSEFPNALLENHYTIMESCSLAHNRIQHLVANSNMMIQIKSLSLEFNPLSRESNELILFEQRNARHLNLAATRLYAIQQATLAAEQLALSQANSLPQFRHRLANQTSQLDLIRSISSQINAPYLRHLNLSSNQLVWLAANVFDKMHSLQTLDLSNNQLTRLHLLNNQLAHVAATLDYLNMNSNLFTNIDANDFSQLSNLRHLDLSNLLSLQKMNCKFLTKLSSLKSLRMLNYPRLRQTIQSKLSQLTGSMTASDNFSERLARKIRQELLLSSIGQHCVVSEDDRASAASQEQQQQLMARQPNLKWFNLNELELELFNSFTKIPQLAPVSELQENPLASFGQFRLTHELSQFLGPQTRKLTLIGLNISSISDFALIGIASPELQLKISYTSLAQLPLRQIMLGITKRTRLRLDFRNNNIQTIDTSDLQWLDELQQNNQAFQHGDRFSLRLSSNPFRCDCRTRPLWLWLNQRWDQTETISSSTLTSFTDNSEQQVSDTRPPTQALPVQLKYNAISHTSDIKCYYPQKLRGKLAQHVYYNDLVCKSSSPPSQNPIHNNNNPTLRASRKRNETTKSSESHYLASIYNPEGEADEIEDDSDYITDSDQLRTELVKLTKFNRYQPVLANYSLYFIKNNIYVPPGDKSEPNVNGQEGEDGTTEGSTGNNIKHFKRDQHSIVGAPATSGDGIGDDEQGSVNTKYSKHRPNTHQRHSHFNTLTSLQQISIAKQLHGGRSAISTVSSSNKPTFLTESDVMILTLISIAMTVMTLVIISVCLIKNRLERSEKDYILNSHGKMLLSKALLMDAGSSSHSSNSKGVRSAGTSSASNSSSSSSPRNAKRQLGDAQLFASRARAFKTHRSGRSCQSAVAGVQVHRKPQHYASQQVLIPMAHSALAGPAAHNFLMRSPTIRRMHGLASNASDWFKFTLRAYPNRAASRRRRIFLGPGKQVCGGLRRDDGASKAPTGLQMSSQLTTAQLKHQMAVAQSAAATASILDPSNDASDPKRFYNLSVAGCPIHAFEAVRKFEDLSLTHCVDSQEDHCNYCRRLVSAIRQTTVQHLARPMGRNHKSGSGSRSDSSGEQPVLTTDEQNYLPPKLIKALARQLDQEEADKFASSSAAINATSVSNSSSPEAHYANAQNQHPKVRDDDRYSSAGQALYHSRDQPARSMRTFGQFNARSSTTNTITSTKTQQSESDLVQSQIPTVDVDGRFTYQSESQLDSPRSRRLSRLDPLNSAQAEAVGSKMLVDGLNGSIEEQGEVFVFNRDTPVGTSEQHFSTRFEAEDSRSRPQSSALNSDIAGLAKDEASRNSLVINDECSHSSSPVAYGFMRSSPSATTISSHNTMTQNQYIVNNSPVKSRKKIHTFEEIRSYQNDQAPRANSNGDTITAAQVSSQRGVSNSEENAINNNNNSQDYVVGKKRADSRLIPDVDRQNDENPDITGVPSADDHVIVSRL